MTVSPVPVLNGSKLREAGAGRAAASVVRSMGPPCGPRGSCTEGFIGPATPETSMSCACGRAGYNLAFRTVGAVG